MSAVWFCILALAACLYAVLDGFDFGAGMLHRFVAKTDSERRTVFAAIGPYWDGNEVWLIAMGGILFCAFPGVLGAALSGLYLAVFHILWALVLRGISIEFRSHVVEPLWRAFWDTVFQLSSLVLAVLFGAALGNLVRGFAIDEEGCLDLSLFDGVKLVDERGILDGYTVTIALFVTTTLASHGSLFLLWKTDGVVAERARSLAKKFFAGRIVLWLASAAFSVRVRPDFLRGSHPFMWAFFALSVVSLGLCMSRHAKGQDRMAFVLSAANVFSLVAMVGAASFPELLHARSGVSYVAQTAASPDTSLRTALSWWIPAALLVLGYFTIVFRFHRGKARA